EKRSQTGPLKASGKVEKESPPQMGGMLPMASSSRLITMVAADHDRTMAASPLRVPGHARTSVQCSELHSRPCARSSAIPGNAEQNPSMVLLSQVLSAHRNLLILLRT